MAHSLSITDTKSCNGSNESDNRSSTETLEDEEVFPRIDEEALNRLPPRFQRNLRSLQQDAIDRLSRTNLNLEANGPNHQESPTDQNGCAERTQAILYQSNSNTSLANLQRENGSFLEMEEGPSKYLSVRNPDSRGSRARDGAENNEEAGKKHVQFDLPESDNTSAAGPSQGPVSAESFDSSEAYRLVTLEPTGPWTVSGRSHSLLSGETPNPYAPYTSALREEFHASGISAGNEGLENPEPKRKRFSWLIRFLELIGIKDRKDKKP